MKRKLFVLANSVWHADDYLNDRNCNPKRTDKYLFATEQDAREAAMKLPSDDADEYNDCLLYSGEIEEKELLEITMFDDIKEFLEILATPDDFLTREANLHEDEISDMIIDNNCWEENIPCANYDFNKSIEGAIIVVWSWEKYVGYARKCKEIRKAYYGETEQMLTKQDRTFVDQVDVIMTKEEVEACDDLQLELIHRLKSDWKWTNPIFVGLEIGKF